MQQPYTAGMRVTGRDATNYTEHTGPVVDCSPSAFYADGTPREFRTVIQDGATGRRVILWQGTERAA